MVEGKRTSDVKKGHTQQKSGGQFTPTGPLVSTEHRLKESQSRWQLTATLGLVNCTQPLNSTEDRPMQPWGGWCTSLYHHSESCGQVHPLQTTSPAENSSETNPIFFLFFLWSDHNHSLLTVSTLLPVHDMEGRDGSWSTGAHSWSSLQCHRRVH